MKKTFENFFSKISYFIGYVFVKGLITILPLTLTIALLNVSFKILKNWLQPIYKWEPEYLKAIPFSEFLLAILVILIIGTFVNIFILGTLVHVLESVVFKIPLVRPIYSGIKQLVHAFNPQDKVSFKKVVIIEFPRKGIYSLGFLTSELPLELTPDTSMKYFNVFVPTTPNPTTGFFFMVSEDNVKVIDLSRQEAMALIISGGIIQPERFSTMQK